nr:synaptobrevin, longin-like domain protein [Tanacetum cinerariifolium]
MIAILEKIETTDKGTKILTTIDGKTRTIFESSIRRNLKLRDEAGIGSLPDAELFENLTLMGYNISPNQTFSFQKGQFSHHWKYLIHTIMQCLSPKSTSFNEFSSNIATALVCLATNKVYNFSKMIFDGMVRNVNNKVSKFLMYPRTVPLFDTMLVHQGKGSGTPTEPHHTPSLKAPQSPQRDLSSLIHPHVTTLTIPTVIPTDTPLRQYTKRARIAQSLALPTIADEPAFPLGDDSQGEACPTVFGFKAEHNRANIINTSTLPSDSTPRVTSLAADEGKDRDGGGDDPSREDATSKGRSLEIGEEAGIERSTDKGSNDTEEMVNVLTSLDAASILMSGVQLSVPPAAEVATVSIPPAGEIPTVSVPTGSGMVATASPIFTTATVATPYSRRKGKEKMLESETPKKKKLQEQMDVQMARLLEEEIGRDAQRMNEQIARDAEISRIHAKEELQMLIDSLDRKNETVAKYLQEYEQFAGDLSIGERIELINDLVKYQDNYAKVLKYQSQQRKPLSKKQQREFYMSIEDFVPMGSKEKGERFKRKGLRLEQETLKKIKTVEDVSEEDLKEMMQLVLVEEVYVEALQHFDKEDLNQLWALVKETLNIRQATSDKEKELWVELKRLYEPDVEDHLWT